MKLAASLIACLSMGATALAAQQKPNIVVILTDDQDLLLGSMDYMPLVKKHLTDQGMYFNHHYATVALCCPSRASMWTGKAAHNTNITDLHPPYGGYPKFIDEGYNTKWLPVWLKAAGYQTYYTGKLMNGHTIHNYHRKLKKLSLDGHDFMIEPGTYQYTNTTFQHNLEKPKSHPNEYSNDVLTEKSLAWIDKAAQHENKAPFFLAINPITPHSNLDWHKGWAPPVPAKRHEDAFRGVKVPRNVSFNPDKPSGASWVKQLNQLSDNKVDENDQYYRRRLQALQSVDELVEKTVERLSHHNMLSNTYIIYTSDNGYHISQHRLTPGKRCPYEEDINVPMVIRGPGVPKGKTVDFVTSHLDIAPTIVNWAGAKGPGDFDGSNIPVDGEPGTQEPWEHVQVEHWGMVSNKKYHYLRGEFNTYKAVRLIGPNYNLYYSAWCNGDHEVYDMTNDPHQMHNIYDTKNRILNVSMEQLHHRLDALLLVTKTCSGKTCRQPWKALHPNGEVQTLTDALDSKFDHFYKDQPKVQWEQCDRAYFIQNEMPIHYMTFGDHSSAEERSFEAMANWERFTD